MYFKANFCKILKYITPFGCPNPVAIHVTTSMLLAVSIGISNHLFVLPCMHEQTKATCKVMIECKVSKLGGTDCTVE